MDTQKKQKNKNSTTNTLQKHNNKTQHKHNNTQNKRN